LILQLVEGGELFDKIITNGHMNESQARNIIRQAMEALQYLHAHKIVHRDLKPENLLCKDNSLQEILLGDFGFARVVQDNEQTITQCGSLHYTAPEILCGQLYGPPVDMWSMGVIAFVLLTGCFPWEGNGDDIKGILSQIINVSFKFPSNVPISPSAKHLITHLLVKEPEGRYTAEQVLNHPWVQGRDTSTIQRNRSYVNLLEGIRNTSRVIRTKSADLASNSHQQST